MADYTNPRTNSLPDPASPGFRDGDTISLQNGSRFSRQNGRWEPIAFQSGSAESPLTVRNSAQGVRIIAPSGTVAADGTITLGTALQATYSAGVELYLPAGAISGGSAGWYRAVMSSTTVGQISGAVGSGSAYTGVTSEITARESTISWSVLASGRQVLCRAVGLCNNTAGTKTYRMRIGATQVNSAAPASQLGFGAMLHVQYLGGGLLSVVNALAAGGTNTAAVVTVTEGQDVTIAHTLQIAAATDHAALVSTSDVQV